MTWVLSSERTWSLEGSVLRSGDKLRINARLVRVSDDVPTLVQ